MIKLDAEFLREVGLASLSEQTRNAFLDHVYETLEQRVGETLSSMMTESQLDEFYGFAKADDNSAALDLLEGTIPQYREVVQDELRKIKDEIRSVAKEILDDDKLRDLR